MSTNPYQLPQEELSTADDRTSVEWSTGQKIWFLLAAVPAVYPLFCLLVLYLHRFFGLKLSEVAWLLSGFEGAIFIQVWIYILWTVLSRELGGWQKVGWIILLVVLQWLTIPLMLWAKYRGTTARGLRSIVSE